MRTVLILVVAALLARASVRFGEERSTSTWEQARVVERGQYLVHSVAMCVQCHSPRGADGELLEEQLLEGAPVPLEAPFEGWDWALRAPRLAGLPGYDAESGVRLLMEGVARDGHSPRPPMPPYRMQRGDAEAVVAYLMSLE